MIFSVIADRPRVEIPIALSSVAIRKNLYMLEMPWQSSMHKPKKDRPISCRDLGLGGKEDKRHLAPVTTASRKLSTIFILAVIHPNLLD